MKKRFLVFVTLGTALATVLGANVYAQTVTTTPTVTPSPSPTTTTPGGAPQTGFGTLAK